eukprot:COSAG01_NODE_3330_length_6246_cov_4.593298_3_plen_68_part_00
MAAAAGPCWGSCGSLAAVACAGAPVFGFGLFADHPRTEAAMEAATVARRWCCECEDTPAALHCNQVR